VTSFAVGESVLAVCGVNPRLRGKEDIGLMDKYPSILVKLPIEVIAR
jgi:hypothetical protein